MKRTCRALVLACASVFCLVSPGRDTPILNGRLESDLNANGHTITNLPPGFFPEGGGVSSNDVRRMISDLAPAPGNYETVSNRAMTALQTHQDISGKADATNVYTKAQTDARIVELAHQGMTTNDVCNIVTNVVEAWSFGGEYEFQAVGVPWYQDGEWRCWYNDSTETGVVAGVVTEYGTDGAKVIEFNDGGHVNFTALRDVRNALGLARMSDLPPLTNGLASTSITNGFITDAYISTNNAAFVTAVTNCPVAIAASDAEALAEWGIYGGGGTIGALLAALAAAVAALKKKKMPLYPVGGTGNPVNATIESGVLTVAPFAMAAYAPTASAAFSVAMGSLPSDFESGKARDAVLVIDCSLLSEGDEPTVTWGVNFHPRTDAGTDFACVAGAKNVYYISEYASGEFAVGGWTETAGGNA